MLTDGSKVEIYLAPFCLVFIKNELKGQLYTPILISDREQFLIGYLTYVRREPALPAPFYCFRIKKWV